MKTRRIDEFGYEYYYCDRCGEAVDEYDDYCDICGSSLSSASLHSVSNKKQAEGFFENKYKIMNIRETSTQKLGKCILVEVNPVKLEVGGVFFTPYVYSDTLRFIYPNTQKKLEYLINIAKNSLLNIDLNDFRQERITMGDKSFLMYKSEDFFNQVTNLLDKKFGYYSRPEFYNGIIDLSLISKTDEESKYKIALPNGDCYIGEIKDNIISGWGKYYFSNGKNIQKSELDMNKWSYQLGYYKNGLPNGIGVFQTESRDYPQNPTVVEWGYFLNGKKNGACLCMREGATEVGIYRNDEKIKDLCAEFVKIVGVEAVETFWYERLGLWIGEIYSDYTNDYNGLLILNNGDCYIGTMLGGFNRTKIRGIKVLSNGLIESGEWTLDIKGMTPTEWAFI